MVGPILSRISATRLKRARPTIRCHEDSVTSEEKARAIPIDKISECLKRALQHDVQLLRSLCLTSKAYRDLVQPVLYSQGLSGSIALKDSPQDRSAILLTRTLLTKPHLAQSITSLSFMTLSCGSDLGKAKIIWNERKRRWMPVGKKLSSIFTPDEQTKLFDIFGSISDILLEYKAARPKGSLSLELREAIVPALFFLCSNLKEIRVGSVLGPSQPDPILLSVRNAHADTVMLSKLSTVTLYRWPDITNVYQRESEQQLLYTWDLRDLLQSQSLSHLALDWIHSRPFPRFDLAVKSNITNLTIRGLVCTKDVVKLLECCPKLESFEYVVMMDHPGQEWDSRGLVPALSEVSQTLQSLTLILPPPTAGQPDSVENRHPFYLDANMVKDDHQREEICSLAPFPRMIYLAIDIHELATMAARTKCGVMLYCLPPNIQEIRMVSGGHTRGPCAECQYGIQSCTVCEEDSIVTHLVEELLDEGLSHYVSRLSKIYVSRQIERGLPHVRISRPAVACQMNHAQEIEIKHEFKGTDMWQPMQIQLSEADLRTETEDYRNNMHHVQDGGFEPPSEDSDEDEDG